MYIFVIITFYFIKKSEFIAYNIKSQLDDDSGSSTLSLSRTSSDDSLKLRLQNNKQIEAAAIADSKSVKINRSVSSRLKSKLFTRNTKLMSSFRPSSVVQVSNINNNINSNNNRNVDYFNRHNNLTRSALNFKCKFYINLILYNYLINIMGSLIFIKVF